MRPAHFENRLRSTFSSLDARFAPFLTEWGELCLLFTGECGCTGCHLLRECEDVERTATHTAWNLTREIRWETRVEHRQGCRRRA